MATTDIPAALRVVLQRHFGCEEIKLTTDCEIVAWGVMPNTNTEGEYHVGWLEDVMREWLEGRYGKAVYRVWSGENAMLVAALDEGDARRAGAREMGVDERAIDTVTCLEE